MPLTVSALLWLYWMLIIAAANLGVGLCIAAARRTKEAKDGERGA